MVDLATLWWIIKFIVKLVGGSILINIVTGCMVVYCLIKDMIFRSDAAALVFWIISSSVLAAVYGIILAV